MTSKLEETLNLPKLEDILRLAEEEKIIETEQQLSEAEEDLKDLRKVDPRTAGAFEQALEKTEALQREIVDCQGLEDHDKEMDEIAKDAKDSYEVFQDLALNTTPAHAGKIAETSANFLRISLDAKNSKADKKLRMGRLLLEQARLMRDLASNNKDSAYVDDEEAINLDRNSLLEHIRSELSKEELKK